MTEILAEVYRNNTVESIHYGSIVVSDKDGNILYSCGDPDKVTFTRSSAKAFQFLAVYESGAIKKHGFDLQQVAIMLGSHNGSELHQEVVKSNLEILGLDESYLRCGTHVPLEYKYSDKLPHRDEKFSPMGHNCSGKHSGQLALALTLGDDLSDYINPDSNTQKRVREIFSELYDYPINMLKMGTDGCSLPNYALPLKNMAKAYAQIVTCNTKSDLRREAFELIIDAMRTHPLMVSGKGRFDLAITEGCDDVILKVGGEAVETIGILSKGLGIAIKISDGNPRALGPVIIETLCQLGVMTNNEAKAITDFYRVQLYNSRKVNIGEIIPVFNLKRG